MSPPQDRFGDHSRRLDGRPGLVDRAAGPAATAVIAEDEENLRDELRETLAAVWPELDIRAEAADGFQAIAALDAHSPDALFLDIEMPGMSGLEVARRASERTHIVFVTAYDKYAVEAFERGAVDYVMKPFSLDRLADTVNRLRSRIRSAPANLDGLLQALAARFGGAREHIRWITASHGNDLRLITVEEIVYFQAGDRYTRVVTVDKESLIRRTIRDLAEDLDPKDFWQIHRATIVNVNAIAGITRDFRRRMRVRLKARSELLAVSDPYTHRFEQM
jgi:DNA-binding LytR/AlgR family response regulator